MSGTAVIHYLLENYSAVTTLVPADDIHDGLVQEGDPLPAIGIETIGARPRLDIPMAAPGRMITERVRVHVMDTAKANVKTVMHLLMAACPNQRSTVNTIVVDSILPDLQGPEFFNPKARIYTESMDFIVKWKWTAP